MDDRWEDMIRQDLIRHHLIQPLMNIQLEMLKQQKRFSREATGGRLRWPDWSDLREALNSDGGPEAYT